MVGCLYRIAFWVDIGWNLLLLYLCGWGCRWVAVKSGWGWYVKVPACGVLIWFAWEVFKNLAQQLNLYLFFSSIESHGEEQQQR
jgi:hypothetical protein